MRPLPRPSFWFNTAEDAARVGREHALKHGYSIKRIYTLDAGRRDLRCELRCGCPGCVSCDAACPESPTGLAWENASHVQAVHGLCRQTDVSVDGHCGVRADIPQGSLGRPALDVTTGSTSGPEHDFRDASPRRSYWHRLAKAATTQLSQMPTSVCTAAKRLVRVTSQALSPDLSQQ